MLNRDIRVDLHIHSKASKYKESTDADGRSIVDESDSDHLDVLFRGLEKHGINLISITDHNRFDVDLYRAVNQMIASGRGGSVQAALPGIEFDVEFQPCHPQAHVIAIFDASEWNDDCDKWENDYRKIGEAIENNKLEDPEGKYTQSEFEAILKAIGKNVILIAHQHQSLTSTNVKKRSLSSATDDAEDLVRFKYIDALEYTSSKVEGILLSDLATLDVSTSTIVGSDCHTWSAYPKHDRGARERESFFSTIRALPTFKGLLMALTSPRTRFQQPDRPVNSSFLDHFTVNGVEVDLSPGINAIIGENGAGKSSLLEMMMTGGKQSQSHVKKLQQDNRIDMPKTLSGGDNVLYVRQNDLERRYWNKGGMFEESQYPQVDNSAFERKMRAWSASVKGAVKRHIQSKTLADRLATTSYVIKPQLEAGTYYPHIAKSEGFERVENPHKARLENINNALDILNSEMGSGYYKDDSQEKADLQTAISALCRISEVISSRSQRATKISEARNAVSLAISKYNSSIQPLQTAKDREKTDYQRKKSAVLDAVVEEARNACKPPVNIVPISLPAGAGTSENPSRGFKFVSTAAYSDNSEIAETFLAENMNVRFQTLEDVLKIQSTQEIEAAIPRRRQGDWEARWDSMVENFISDEEKMSRFIKGNSDRRVGNTLGEQSLTYYEYCSYQGSGIDVFVIDQPEDHISNARISKRLIGFFNRMRRAKQVILVTHSPLLVVNQDVDNVVCLKTEAGKMSVKSGCLEYGDILQEISQQMDGGTEAIKRRLRVYGEAV